MKPLSCGRSNDIAYSTEVTEAEHKSEFNSLRPSDAHMRH